MLDNQDNQVDHTGSDNPNQGAEIAHELVVTDKPPEAEEIINADEHTRQDEPVENTQPPSATHATSPRRETEDMDQPMTNPEVTNTGEGQGAPNTSGTLAKIPAKDGPVPLNKGKAKLEFPNLECMNVEELHQGFLTQLSESRDSEISMINMLKKKYEVK